MTTSFAPTTSLPPRQRLWDHVEDAYRQVKLAQVKYGDLSPQARSARQMVSRAWLAYEIGIEAPPTRPIVTHRPLVAEVEIQLAVDLDDVGYQVALTLDGQGPDAAHVALVALAAINALTDLEGAAAGRDDVRSADLFSRSIIALTLWRQGWLAAQLDDTAA